MKTKKRQTVFLSLVLFLVLSLGEALAFGGNRFQGEKPDYSENQCQSPLTCTYGNMLLQRRAIML